MNQLALLALLAWPVMALALFAVLPPRRAVIATFLGSWLFLPFHAGIVLSGLPNYTQFTAGVVGALLGVALFDAGRLSAFRARWYDLPMLVWCLTPMASSLTNGLGAYDGLSGIFNHLVQFGAPYYFGRIYFTRPDDLIDLALGLVIGGVAYVPLIVFEVGAQRSLNGLLYGLNISNGYKRGLYNPIVFTFHSLELALWMSLSALAGFWLWVTGAVRQLAGLPFGFWTWVLVAGALLCHQTGAMVLLLSGMVLIASTAGRARFGRIAELLMWSAVPLVVPTLGFRRALALAGLVGLFQLVLRRHPRWIAWALTSIPPLYIAARSTGLWDGREAVTLAYALFGGARGWSFEFRIINETPLVARALQRPLFGWGGFGRSRTSGSVTDGLWIIYMGMHGIIGLGGLYSSLWLGQSTMARGYSVPRWSDPRLAPVAALGFVLAIFTADSLLNSAPAHPAVSLIVGGLIALPAPRSIGTTLRAQDPEITWADRLAASGRRRAAEVAYRQIIATGVGSGTMRRPSAATAYEHLADLLATEGRSTEAESARRHALALREQSANNDPDSARALALGHERLARELAAIGRVREALPAWERSVQLREAMAIAAPGDPEATRAWADSLNNLAWLLANATDPESRDPARAARLAERAIALDPARKTYWNSLGAAYCRLGEWNAAVTALNRSLRLGDEGAGFDYVLLAMAHRRNGCEVQARDYLCRADDWIAAHCPVPASLSRLRDEAATAAMPPTQLAGPIG